MTIIAILLAFALCHFIRELGKCRKNQWLRSWINFSNDAFWRMPGWQNMLGFLLIAGCPLLLLVFISLLLYLALGTIGTFLLATAVLIYSYGPEDLDTEVAGIIDAEDEETRQKLLEKFLGTAIPEDEDACRVLAVESVFREGLRRWFGIIFWFAVLGITGAFLYRLVDWLVSEDYPLAEGQKTLFIRLQGITTDLAVLVVADTAVVLAVQLVEADRDTRIDGVVQPDGNRHHREAKVSLPH